MFDSILRPNIISDDPEPFVEALANAMRELAQEVGVRRQAEPERLLEAKEYRAAVISAMTLLEAKLRDRLNKSPWPETRNPLAMRSLLKLAVDQHVLDRAEHGQLEHWMRLRNEVVHSSKDVTRAQAVDIVRCNCS